MEKIPRDGRRRRVDGDLSTVARATLAGTVGAGSFGVVAGESAGDLDVVARWWKCGLREGGCRRRLRLDIRMDELVETLFLPCIV